MKNKPKYKTFKKRHKKMHKQQPLVVATGSTCIGAAFPHYSHAQRDVLYHSFRLFLPPPPPTFCSQHSSFLVLHPSLWIARLSRTCCLVSRARRQDAHHQTLHLTRRYCLPPRIGTCLSWVR